MKTQFVKSADGTDIAYTLSGSGETALLFSHGWLGNKDWWLDQEKEFKNDYLMARMDLAGHGESGRERQDYTSALYAEDMIAVANAIPAKNIIVVGHSMSGSYALEAAPKIKNLRMIVVVDTLKDVTMMMDPKITEQIFAGYIKDFPSTVKNELPKFLYAKETPPAVIDRLAEEFVRNSGEFAVKVLAALYRMNLVPLAQAVKVPVRAINCDFIPTNVEANKKTFPDYEMIPMSGAGHYPMLERPEEFNSKLRLVLK